MNDHLKIAIKDRDAAKRRARELEAEARELKAWKAEREAAEAAAAEENERKKNDFAALTAREQAKREAAEKRAAEAEAKLQARERADREAALVDAVLPKLGVQNRVVVKGVLKELASLSGLDIAPESIDERTATDVAKQVRQALGELFPTQSGGSPGTPGVNLNSKKTGERPDEDPRKAAVLAVAKKYSV